MLKFLHQIEIMGRKNCTCWGGGHIGQFSSKKSEFYNSNLVLISFDPKQIHFFDQS